MMELILGVAKADERVRVVGLNGSRTNENVPKDVYRDYDAVYLVTDMESFLADPAWIDVFGERIILQTPEAMSLFPPSLGGWFTYLMLFEDGNRIDLMLIPIEDLGKYLKNDKLLKILLDKDGRVPELPPPTDADYHTKKPTAQNFFDCCNEFFFVSTYVAKGLVRHEMPYAVDHLAFIRSMLFQMLAWEKAAPGGYTVSFGKNYKYLLDNLEAPRRAAVLRTYDSSSEVAAWNGLFTLCGLFSESAEIVSGLFGYEVKDYAQRVIPYLQALYRRSGV